MKPGDGRLWDHNNLVFNTGVNLVAHQHVHSRGISDRGTTRSVISFGKPGDGRLWGNNNLAFNTGVNLVANQHVHSKGISDMGTTRSVISLAEAKRIRQRGTIASIDWIPLGNSTETIVFGKAGATEPVIATIQGNGLLTTVPVVNNVEATLIADTDFTRHGIVLLQDDTTTVGIHGKDIVFRGVRDSSARKGTSDQLWMLDIDTLLQQAAPTAGVTVETVDVTSISHNVMVKMTSMRNTVNHLQVERDRSRLNRRYVWHDKLLKTLITQHLGRS